MKKNILSLAIILLMVGTVCMQAGAVNLRTKNTDIAGTVELTLHIFKDKNENGQQDADETDEEVNGFKVEILSPLGVRLPKRVVEGTGSATFNVLEGSRWMMYGYEKADWLLNDQWKGSKGVSFTGITIDSDITYNIPLIFKEKKSFSSPFIKLLYNFPLLQQLLKL